MEVLPLFMEIPVPTVCVCERERDRQTDRDRETEREVGEGDIDLKVKNESVSVCMHAKSFQLCLTLCDPKDNSLPGSSVHGISQARIVEWVAISSSQGSSRPRN